MMVNSDLKEFKTKDIIQEKVDMKKYIDELVANLKKDTDVYESLKPFGLTMREVRENIGKLADFQEDFNICKNCPGLEKCPKTTKHISMYVYKDGTYLTTRSEPCKKKIEEMKLDARYIVKDFPDAWKKSAVKKLDSFDERLEVLNDFMDGTLKHNSKKWIYIIGNHRIGKSYILVSFANEYAKKKKCHVAVINASKRFKDLADIVFSKKDAFKKALETLENVPLLVIDDFGEEFKSELVRDQIVIPLLTERARNDRLTFFSSEFTLKEIQQLYSIGKTGGFIRGKQLASLLQDMCEKEYDLTGASIYRK